MIEQVEKSLAVTADLVALVQEKLQQAVPESTVTKKEVTQPRIIQKRKPGLFLNQKFGMFNKIHR